MHVCVKMMSKGSKEALTVLIMAIFISFDSFNIGYFVEPCKIPCNIPWVLQKLLFLHISFWQEGSLNISNHLPDSSFG